MDEKKETLIIQKVTCVHKANIMKLGDGLFLNTCKRVAEQEYGHTGIEFDSMIVDNTSMQLVSKPQQFDVMVMVCPPPFYCILADDLAQLVRKHRQQHRCRPSRWTRYRSRM
jgi:isocitrate dehydrogenase (NAD+)